MKIEIGESLMLSWLRHIKGCQSVQLNWKPSVNHWELNNAEDIERVIQRVNNYFVQKYSYNIFKNNKSYMQLLQQSEIDALGLKIKSGVVQEIYGIDVAFHENGLNYGSKTETIERIIKKSIRTAMLLYGYLNIKKGTIIFASPKIYQALNEPLLSVMEELEKLLSAYGFDFKIQLLANENFNDRILLPVKNLSSSVADTSELFLRSIQLNNMFDDLASRTVIAKSNIAATKEVISETNEIPIGALVRSTFMELIDQNKLSNENIYYLCDLQYCKERFLLPYPMLKKLESGMDISAQRQVHGGFRYYAKPINIHGERYLLCNHWIEKSRKYYTSWLENVEKSINRRI